MIIPAAQPGVALRVLTAGITGPGRVFAVPSTFNNHTFYVRGSTGVSAGQVIPETSPTFDEPGSWAPIGGAPMDAMNNGLSVINFNGVYLFFRVNISTDIVGGDVTVDYVGMP